jgi:hypothetical protein
MQVKNGDVVVVNIIDSSGGVSPEQMLFGDSNGNWVEPKYIYSERWVIGQRISLENYLKFKDPTNDELYALIAWYNGKEKGMLLTKSKWYEAKRRFEQIL